MNKKVLVITLALVVALAGSAMAAVTVGGDFTATMKQENFKVFKEGYSLTPSVQFKISASNKNETKSSEVVESVVVDAETGEEIVVLETKENKQTNWDFSARLNSWSTAGATQFGLERFKLEVNDQYFTAWVWGKQNLTDKATYFDFVKAAKAGGDMSVRLQVPVMDLAVVTADFRAKDNMRVFAEGSVEGFDIGLAYARTDWTTEAKKADVIVGQVGTTLPAGAFDLALEAAAGVSLGDDLGFALGLGAETNVTDEVEVEASVKFENEHWKGGGFDVAGQATVLGLGATYEVTNLQVSADFEQTLKESANANELNLDVRYRFSDKVAFNRLFNTDTSYVMWYENNAPAVRAFADVVDFKLEAVGTEFGAEVAAPVVENIVWAKAYANYGFYKYDDQTTHKETAGGLPLYKVNSTGTPDEKKNGTTDPSKAEQYENDKWGRTGLIPIHESKEESGFKVGADLYIQATPKLSVEPYASYASLGEVLTLGSKAAYKLGLSDTTLNLEVKKVTAADSHLTSNVELIQASVKIPF